MIIFRFPNKITVRYSIQNDKRYDLTVYLNNFRFNCACGRHRVLCAATIFDNVFPFVREQLIYSRAGNYSTTTVSTKQKTRGACCTTFRIMHAVPIHPHTYTSIESPIPRGPTQRNRFCRPNSYIFS